MRRQRQRVRRRVARPARRRFRDRLITGIWRLALALLIVGIVTVVTFGGTNLWDFTQNSEMFRLRRTEITGVSPPIEARLLSRLSDIVADGATIFTVSPGAVRTGLLAEPRLEPTTLSVRRRWPDTLEISAFERIPVAIVADPRLALVDADGWIIDHSPEAIASADLPVLTGLEPTDVVRTDLTEGERLTHPDAQCLLEWLGAFRHHLPRVHRELAELHISPHGEVTARLIGGSSILLGDRGPLEQMPVLITFTQEIEADLTALTTLDLRMEDKLAFHRRDALASAGGASPASSTSNSESPTHVP